MRIASEPQGTGTLTSSIEVAEVKCEFGVIFAPLNLIFASPEICASPILEWTPCASPILEWTPGMYARIPSHESPGQSVSILSSIVAYDVRASQLQLAPTVVHVAMNAEKKVRGGSSRNQPFPICKCICQYTDSPSLKLAPTSSRSHKQCAHRMFQCA
eukprot:gene5989-5280_t